MPTAARLVAALCLALLAFVVSGQIMPRMPEDTNFGWFTHVNVALGLVVGWVVMGRRANQHSLSGVITNGLTGMLVLVFWGLFVQGANEMVRLAMRNRYDGPFEAIFAVFEEMIEYGAVLLYAPILLTLAIGGVLAGYATDFAWRRWR